MNKWNKTTIKDLRLALKMEQIPFAIAVHVSPTTVSRWENGHSLPDKRAKVFLDELELQATVAA
jgi:DNA-binding transcriptional regulator YiaG